MTTGGATGACANGGTEGAVCILLAAEAWSAANCCWMSWLISAELSWPQLWQMNRTGERTMSAVTSKAYLVPQPHWIFIR